MAVLVGGEWILSAEIGGAAADEIDIYADGACRGNPGPGGWGALLRCRGRERELYGSEPMTTNNRMEMMAVISALQSLTRSCRVQVYTDSRYVCDGMRSWLSGWKRRGWRTAQGGAVKNQDLWQLLDAEQERHEVAWHWVKGHAGHRDNERVDRLANRAIDEMQARS